MTPAEEFASAFGGGDPAYTAQLLAMYGGSNTTTPQQTQPTAQPAPTTAPTVNTATSLPGKLPAVMLADFGLNNPHYLSALAAEATAGIPYVAPGQYPGAPSVTGYTPPAGSPPTMGGGGGLTMNASPYAAMLQPQQMQGPTNGKTPTSDIYAAMQQFGSPNGYQNYLNTFQNILNAPRSVIPQVNALPALTPAPVVNAPATGNSGYVNPNRIPPSGPNAGTDWASLYGG